MSWPVTSPGVVLQLPSLAAGLRAAVCLAGTECREKIAHGASRGTTGGEWTSPVGAIENTFSVDCRLVRVARSRNSVAPSGAPFVLARFPTAGAVGYSLSPLRG